MSDLKPQHVISAAVLAAALLVATPWINRDEGYSLKSYPDVGNVWTACRGVAYVLPNHTYTEAECREMDAVAKGEAGQDVVSNLKVDVPVPTLAAHVHFEYNVGMKGYKESKTLRLTNAGDIAGGCEAMMNFHKAGGLDCRIRANNCYGLINRRLSEITFCLSGVK